MGQNFGPIFHRLWTKLHWFMSAAVPAATAAVASPGFGAGGTKLKT